jgi:AraC family transcriptional regulator
LNRVADQVEQAVRRRRALDEPGGTVGRTLARGVSWSVADVLCTRGPEDRPFEECHAGISISVVVAGTFQYRADGPSELLTPGSLLLGNDAQSFECSHEHASGDRCVAFKYSPDYFERIAADAGAKSALLPVARIPPLPEFAQVSADVTSGLLNATDIGWAELALIAAARALQLASRVPDRPLKFPRDAAARVTEVVRAIEQEPAARHTLDELAAHAGLSPFHFLRTFRHKTGVTPHQFILRTRLRNAATRLTTEAAQVIDVAYDAGFGDLSNFNHAFRAEFGVSPRRFRARLQGRPGQVSARRPH